MGRLVVFMVISLDGFVGGPNGELDWEIRDPLVGRESVPALMRSSSAILLGRGLYEGFEQAWPAMAEDPMSPPPLAEFARWIGRTKKVLFTRSPRSVTWENSHVRVAQNDTELRAEIERLQREEPGDLLVFGGAEFARSVVRLGMVDEYQFKVQPIALGHGLPLFSDIAERRRMKLTSAKHHPSGVVELTYLPDPRSSEGAGGSSRP